MTGTEPCNKKRCFVGIVLFASLALNLFLAGVLVGKPEHERGGRPTPMSKMEAQIEKLEPQYREQAQATMKSYGPEFRTQMGRVMTARKELEALMKSKDYSREAAEKKFAELSGEYLELHAIGQQMTLEIADTLPPEQRVKLLPKPGWKK